MTSLQTGIRQISADSGYYISISSCAGVVFTTPLGDNAPWASTSAVAGLSSVVSSVHRAGTLFRDMGKSIISSGGSAGRRRFCVYGHSIYVRCSWQRRRHEW